MEPKIFLQVGLLLFCSPMMQPTQASDQELSGAANVSVSTAKPDVRQVDRNHPFGRLKCDEDQFVKLSDGVPVCQRCKICRPGKGVVRRCSRYGDTKCKRCKAGFYSNLYTRMSACEPCSKCQHARTKKRCKPDRDTLCGKCDIGYFYNTLYRRCDKCGYCYPELKELPKQEQCSRGGHPEEFQCLPVINPPYDDPPLPNATLIIPDDGEELTRRSQREEIMQNPAEFDLPRRVGRRKKKYRKKSRKNKARKDRRRIQKKKP